VVNSGINSLTAINCGEIEALSTCLTVTKTGKEL
jgi:hypothetical protein